jgi:hypothetical protein
MALDWRLSASGYSQLRNCRIKLQSVVYTHQSQTIEFDYESCYSNDAT